MNGVNLIVADDRRSILDHRTIEKLVHLQYLSLSTNPVGQIPDAIAKLKQLKNLDLRNNKISTVPQSLSQMLKLRKVCRLHRLPLTRNIQLRTERHIAIPLPLNHHRKPLSSSYRTHTIHFAILHYNLLDRPPQNWSRGRFSRINQRVDRHQDLNEITASISSSLASFKKAHSRSFGTLGKVGLASTSA